MRRRELPSRRVVEELSRGAQDGFDRVAFTGGEPTIRRDLLALVTAARRLSYASVKIQSNGLLFTRTNVARLLAAGATLLHVSIHTHDPAQYDALVGREGAYPLMVAGLREAIASGLPVVVDVILKEDTYRDLPDRLAFLARLGVGRVDLWFVSLTDNNREAIGSLPRMTDVVPLIREAHERVPEIELRSLHVPRCLLGELAPLAFDPGADRVRVVTPDAVFELKDSRLAGRRHVPACAGCEHETICPGARPDYLEVYGDAEIATARGLSPSLAPVRLPLAPKAR